jgi:hypothetical protein
MGLEAQAEMGPVSIEVLRQRRNLARPLQGWLLTGWSPSNQQRERLRANPSWTVASQRKQGATVCKSSRGFASPGKVTGEESYITIPGRSADEAFTQWVGASFSLGTENANNSHAPNHAEPAA